MKRTPNPQSARLASIELFAGCTPDEISAVDQLCTDVVVAAGTTVWRENCTAPQFILLVDGQIEITRGGERVTTLASGSWFGHDALLGGDATETVSGVVTAPSRIIAFSKREFMSLLRAAPTVAATLRSSEPAIASTVAQPDELARVERRPAPRTRLIPRHAVPSPLM